MAIAADRLREKRTIFVWGAYMFRDMRRKRQALSEEEISSILYNGTSGVLALSGDDNYPYAVPINYVYDGKNLYFHCATSGHKLDAIRQNAKASFCVIGQDQIIPSKYTSHFKSVIAFGQIEIMEDEREKRAAIEKLAIRFAPEDTDRGRESAIARAWDSFFMLKMSIDHMTGKKARE